MLNIYDISYFYSLAIFKYITSNNIKFYKWNIFLKLLYLISKKDFFYFFYKIDKKKCLNEIYNIINKNFSLSKDMKNFIKIIFEDNMFFKIKNIYFNLNKIYKINKKILNVIVYTKNNYLNNSNIKKIKNIIRYYIKNKRIFFLFKKNKKLIAGFKIYINDLIFDGSLLNIIKKNFSFYKFLNF